MLLIKGWPDAFLLMAVLRRNQVNGKIYIPPKMHRITPKGWHEHRLFRPRDRLIAIGKIEKVPVDKRRGNGGSFG